MHIAQQMPLPLTISCSSKSRLVLPFWYLLTQVVPDKFQKSSKTTVCVCVCALKKSGHVTKTFVCLHCINAAMVDSAVKTMRTWTMWTVLVVVVTVVIVTEVVRWGEVAVYGQRYYKHGPAEYGS